MRYLLIVAMLAGAAWGGERYRAYPNLVDDPPPPRSDNAKTCEECPPRGIGDNEIIVGGTCGASRKVDCNTCSYEVWCINDQWYRAPGEMCTLMGCMGGYEIENPFK